MSSIVFYKRRKRFVRSYFKNKQKKNDCDVYREILKKKSFTTTSILQNAK